jgi:putative transcriptional regulator
MPGKITNRFKKMLLKKEYELGRRITIEEISNATGIAPSTLSAWSSNGLTSYKAVTLIALCDYFDCEVGDLLVYERDE